MISLDSLRAWSNSSSSLEAPGRIKTLLSVIRSQFLRKETWLPAKHWSPRRLEWRPMATLSKSLIQTHQSKKTSCLKKQNRQNKAPNRASSRSSLSRRLSESLKRNKPRRWRAYLHSSLLVTPCKMPSDAWLKRRCSKRSTQSLLSIRNKNQNLRERLRSGRQPVRKRWRVRRRGLSLRMR